MYESKDLIPWLIRSLKAPLALRWEVALGAVVAWNAAFFLAAKLNGAWGVYTEASALFLLSGSCMLFSAALFALVLSPTIRAAATSPKRRHVYAQALFVYIALLLLLMAVHFAYLGLRTKASGAVTHDRHTSLSGVTAGFGTPARLTAVTP